MATAAGRARQGQNQDATSSSIHCHLPSAARAQALSHLKWLVKQKSRQGQRCCGGRPAPTPTPPALHMPALFTGRRPVPPLSSGPSLPE